MLGAHIEPLQERNARAIRAWNLLANGMGGIDWNGFDRIVEHLSIDDEEWLVESLYAIRFHKPDAGLGPGEPDATEDMTL